MSENERNWKWGSINGPFCLPKQVEHGRKTAFFSKLFEYTLFSPFSHYPSIPLDTRFSPGNYLSSINIFLSTNKQFFS